MKAVIIEHLDELFQDVVDISREVRKANFSDKKKEAILNNLQKAAENILVAEKRIAKSMKGSADTKEYEPTSEKSIEIHKNIDKFIKKHGMTPDEWNRRYDRCESCRWYCEEDNDCDHCAYGHPYVDQNGLPPEEVDRCSIYYEKETV